MEHPVRSTLSALTLSLALVTMTACSPPRMPIGNPEAPYPPQAEPVVGEIHHLPTGTRVTTAQMLAAATESRVVYVGETHDNPAAHRLERQVLEAMAERYPGQVSLGMEMFNTGQQAVLDRWIAGELDEKSFLEESQWFDNWRMDFAYYRDLLVFARDRQIPVIGLNAPKSLVEAVSRQPLDQLDPETRAQLPEMDLDEPYQRAMTAAVFAGHATGGNMIDGFHRVQTLWDEMMAESIVRELRQKGPGQRMVVVAGGNHVRYGFGIPRRVYRRLPVAYTMIGVREIEIPEEKRANLMDVDMPRFPMVAYDYLVHVAYESLPGQRVKLGVRFKAEDDRILVESVVPESAAARAGVEAGDILLSLGGVPLHKSIDLVYEVGQYDEGDEAALVVERAGSELTLPVTFTPLPMPKDHGKP